MSKLVLAIGLALLGLSIICFIILSPLLHVQGISSKIIPLTQPIYNTCFGNCSGGPPNIITNGSIGDLLVIGELPEQLNNNTSDTISLVLTLKRELVQGEDKGQMLSPTPIPN